MNARELLDVLDSSGYIEFSNAVLSREHYRQNLELLKSALRLLAAAEANDGTGSQLVEDLRTEADLCRNETATDIADLLDDAASALIATGAQFNALKDELNGLAARVRELEQESAQEAMNYLARAERAEAALAECRTKLEVDPRTKYDGIDCREETIRLQDEEIERLKKDRDEWKKDATTALGKINEEHIRANNAESALAESERKGERLKFHADGMAYGKGTVAINAMVAYRAEFKE